MLTHEQNRVSDEPFAWRLIDVVMRLEKARVQWP